MKTPPAGNGRPTASERARSLLVTGAAGFIGSHLCERLLEDGHRVWGLDNFDDFYDPARKRENLRSALDHPSMHLVEGDVRDQVLLDGLMADVQFDAVVHLAARPGIQPSVENPVPTFDVNVRGTQTLLEALRRHEVSSLLFASSCAVYGESDPSPYREDAVADRSVSSYAASKRAGEMLCHSYHHLYDLTVHCLRLSPVFGPRQRPDLALHTFARLIQDGQPLPVYGDISSGRDHVYVGDVVDGMQLALDRIWERNGEEPEYRIINLGGREKIELQELVRGLSEALGTPAEVEHRPGRRGDAAPAVASNEQARKLLGYEPTTTFEEGLAEFVTWLRAEGGAVNRSVPTVLTSRGRSEGPPTVE